jgi:hypothetical protein
MKKNNLKKFVISLFSTGIILIIISTINFVMISKIVKNCHTVEAEIVHIVKLQNKKDEYIVDLTYTIGQMTVINSHIDYYKEDMKIGDTITFYLNNKEPYLIVAENIYREPTVLLISGVLICIFCCVYFIYYKINLKKIRILDSEKNKT